MDRPRRICLWVLIACFWGLQALSPSPSLAAGCGTCGGSGTSRLTCSFCKGTGKNGSFKCSFCNGRMFVKCFSCNGTGQTAPTPPHVPGSGAPQPAQVCGSCKGAGTSNLTCSFCKGTGKNGSFKCSFCDGKMFPKCYSCNGSGRRP
jgi:hypothetical protein